MNTLYNAAFFDFDGTLADTRLASVEATQAAFRHFGLTTPDTELILQYMGIPIEKSFDAMRKPSISGISTEDIITYFREIYPSICDKTTHLYEGISELLSVLKEEHFYLAVVTSKKSTVLARNLENLGLNNIFDVIVGSDHVSNYKPHPEPLNMAMHQLNTLARQDISGLMIGDAVSDIEMGQSARVDTCGVTWGAFERRTLEKSSPDYLVSSVSELRTVLFKKVST
ncbi:HAD family hydrolase (plasmid) [Escherichia albertii]|uniref:HAD family hydrolase n=1 Tax=Escherichia albertii TaxID=208962 RepID=UPI0019583FD9|nr:HAD family hydrolase [Escherichia albertii]QST30927.1 HAD family hydrolase [Escherichia albertii]QST40240.1 HAD family hydrolase [Escherichia albertii]